MQQDTYGFRPRASIAGLSNITCNAQIVTVIGTSLRLSRVTLYFLASDLNHVIVKRVCRDPYAIDLCERLEYVE